MSLIGKQPVTIPENVTLTLEGKVVSVKGPAGELTHTIPPAITPVLEDKTLKLSRLDDIPKSRALHGLTRALINNMVIGVTEGFKKNLELIGTGFRVVKQGDKLVFSLGFSHPVEIQSPDGIKFEVEGNTKITISGIDKQKVGQVAAEIRNFRPPEVYKGKGIRYENEVVRRKAGKAAKVGAAGGE